VIILRMTLMPHTTLIYASINDNVEEDKADAPLSELSPVTKENMERQMDTVVVENHKDTVQRPEPPKEFHIDMQAFHDLVVSVADVSDGWSVDELCHLRAELFFSVHSHRMDWDKTNLLQVSS
jgi:hypothetical protein